MGAYGLGGPWIPGFAGLVGSYVKVSVRGYDRTSMIHQPYIVSPDLSVYRVGQPPVRLPNEQG